MEEREKGGKGEREEKGDEREKEEKKKIERKEEIKRTTLASVGFGREEKGSEEDNKIVSRQHSVSN